LVSLYSLQLHLTIRKLDIEKHSENGETYYVATSLDIQGLVAEGATVSESIAIAKDIAEIILVDQFEKKQLLPEVPEKMCYSLILDY
jgi:predicted RNase H-like HicB family nuclease